MKLRAVRFIVCAMACVLAGGALGERRARAQSGSDAPASSTGSIKEGEAHVKHQTDAKGRRITVVTFDDANIEGKAKAPDGFVLQSRSGGSFRNILELKKNFRPQIESTGGEGARSAGSLD